MMQYQVIVYDVWGNEDDGYWVNAAYTTGCFIEVTDKDSCYAINRRLGKIGFDSRGVIWDGEPEFGLYGTDRKGRPALELRPA